MIRFSRRASSGRFPPSRPGRQAGFSMIEVLIALVVLGVGLLGLALLQTMNLRYTKSANQRTQAVNLANELLDTMRANRTEMAAYALTSFGSVTPPAGGCARINALTAAENVARWKCEVRETLGPDASATVVITPADNSVLVTVIWNESNIPTIANQGKIELRTEL